MKRDYTSGVAENITFFIGNEVEKTPAYGMKTLFVSGLQSVEEIEKILNDSFTSIGGSVKHIFFGANHSFDPKFNDHDDWDAWEKMITHFLENDYWCSLDIPLNAVEEFNDGGLNDYHNFIPQIMVPVPYIKLWNYNTMIKIDDKDFKATNPGVWTHSLHELKDRNKFTDWSEYKNDQVIK
jgi:hypothetical protein